jgi:hypothetical protein
MLPLVTDVEAVESYALHSGFTMPAILQLRPKLARTARQMYERGIRGYWKAQLHGGPD